MEKKGMGRIIALLILLSFIIYGLQILIFRDFRTTAFYFLQDMAFMPITIAIVTFAVGGLINENTRKEQLSKTRMLTSSFFTEIGTGLMLVMLEPVQNKPDINKLAVRSAGTDAEVQKIQQHIQEADIVYALDEATYMTTKQRILEEQTAILVMASNPMILEHECFTEMLWSIMHLTDEFRLRGDYQDLSAKDIEHLNVDFIRVLRLMMINWVSNAKYIKDTYPEYYAAAKLKVAEKLGSGQTARQI